MEWLARVGYVLLPDFPAHSHAHSFDLTGDKFVIWYLNPASYVEASVAQILIVCGFIVGGPLWLNLVWPLLVYALPLMTFLSSF